MSIDHLVKWYICKCVILQDDEVTVQFGLQQTKCHHRVFLFLNKDSQFNIKFIRHSFVVVFDVLFYTISVLAVDSD